MQTEQEKYLKAIARKNKKINTKMHPNICICTPGTRGRLSYWTFEPENRLCATPSNRESTCTKMAL